MGEIEELEELLSDALAQGLVNERRKAKFLEASRGDAQFRSHQITEWRKKLQRAAPVSEPVQHDSSARVAELQAQLQAQRAAIEQSKAQEEQIRQQQAPLQAQVHEARTQLSLAKDHERIHLDYIKKIETENTVLRRKTNSQTREQEQWKQSSIARQAALQSELAELQSNPELEMDRIRLAEVEQLVEAMNTMGPSHAEYEELNIAAGGFPEDEKWGEGGQGGVWKARWHDQDVVIKKMVPVDLLGMCNQMQMEETQTEGRAARNEGFVQELIALSSVHSKHVLKVLAFNNIGCPENCKYMVLPFCNGGDLEQAVPLTEPGSPAAADSMDWRSRVSVMIDVCEGLQALHDAKFAHFDIKPQNTLIHNGVGVLADCGLAKPLETVSGLQHTRVGAQYGSWHGPVGTAYYKDPIYAASGGSYTKVCDIYSMGITLLQVLTGRDVCWGPRQTRVQNFEWCLEHRDKISDVSDPKTNWPVEVASAVNELGEKMTSIGRGWRGNRPNVADCILRLRAIANM